MSAFSVPIFPLLILASCLVSFLLVVSFCPDVGRQLVSFVCICFIPSVVAILLLLFLLVLLSFVSFFAGLLVFLRLGWLLLRCVFLRDSDLLLLWFQCFGSSGLSYHSFPHPSFLLASFVLSPLFSSSASAAAFYALWSSPVALFLVVAFISSGFLLGFWHFTFLCLVLPRCLPSFAFLGLQSLSRSFRFLVFCWRFFGTSGSLQTVGFSLWFLTRSDLRFPSGQVRFCFAFCSSLISEFLLAFLFLSVWFSCFPLRFPFGVA